MDSNWDFNEVCVPEDRCNSVFDSNNASHFNNFIGAAGLLEYPMAGRRFTFLSGDGKKMSKINRALVNNEFISKWPNATFRALERTLSDHSPIILATETTDFGPISFRFFNSWLEIPGVEEVVKKGLTYHGNALFKDQLLGYKLKGIKEEIKIWRKALAEDRGLEENEVELWRTSKNKVREWFRRKAKDIQQKARSRWILDGDENSRYFHTIVNCNIARNKLNGLWIDGNWITCPLVIMKHIQENMKTKFLEPVESRARIPSDGFSKISETEAKQLIAKFSREEIKKAVWDCGSDKAPGPDGITFAVIKKF
ncbi:uncharacterized protein LOC118485705 [Helianthus annuus]|uniref:uncharacterized protein LOC118485705 n=1 Tax=Helianthus annuus TaxID=4232 RepID=UPI0016533B3C|nr:uncharacterized protein LOC118485705 [Helianthus annuus]